jgi:8-oxo-dGTP pyrophosphatase MutT (NUDIX family)
MQDLPTFLQRALATRERETLEFSGFRKAAILVPLLQTEGHYELLFTVRASHLLNHAGQISFPGGRLDDGESIEEAARREAFEEVGLELPPSSVLGFLDDVPSPARYVVTPVVAVIEKPSSFVLNHDEVEEMFTVPLMALTQLEPRAEERVLEGRRRVIYFYPYRERLIWGLTGNVLRNLLEVLRSGQQRGESSPQ